MLDRNMCDVQGIRTMISQCLHNRYCSYARCYSRGLKITPLSWSEYNAHLEILQTILTLYNMSQDSGWIILSVVSNRRESCIVNVIQITCRFDDPFVDEPS